MTDHKYTDEQIITALRVCIEGSSCKECPINPNHGNYGYCTNLALTHALNLINRQRAEIERLQNECDQAWEEHSDIQIKYDLLFDEAKALIEKSKAEAVKEFAEILKKEAGYFGRAVAVKDIDDLVKELTNSKRCPDCKYFAWCECFNGPCDLFEREE